MEYWHPGLPCTHLDGPTAAMVTQAWGPHISSGVAKGGSSLSAES